VERFAQQVFRAGFQPWLLRHLQCGGSGRQFAEGGFPASGTMNDAVFGTADGGQHLPFPGRSGNQHLPGGRSGEGEPLPFRADAAAAAGNHERSELGMVVFRGHRRRLKSDRFPVAAEFFGNQHGERGIDPLAHLGFIDDHRYAAVRADAQESVRGEAACRGRSCSATAAGNVAGKQQAAAGQGACLDELSSTHSGPLAHGLLPPRTFLPPAA